MEQIKKQARTSVLSKLGKAKVTSDKKNQERISQTRFPALKDISL